ncbi:MAG: HD domain-containing protein [Nanoarchaeota archaeon]|nr:HD domain-containing protein [Nanoarchaeota archaeon]
MLYIKYKKKQPVSALNDGDKVDDVFVVKIKKAMSSYAKGFFFQLILSDSSGKTLDYRYWGSQDEKKVRALYNSIKADSVVHVQGKVSVYSGKLQLTTNEPFIIEPLKEDEYDKTDFIKPARKNVDDMYSELREAIDEVKNPDIKKLLEDVFNEPAMEAKFKMHPGAIEIHHNWIGGLLEHTLEVLKYSLLSFDLFPVLDKDLLIAGALLHDIGKLDELEMTSRIKGSDSGQLVGHIVLSSIFVSNKMDKLGLGSNLKNKLLHIIVSHHGKTEYGSPKQPMFPEAVVIYYADEMSSKIAEITEFVKDSIEDTEDDFMFHWRKQHNIYLK